MSRLTRFGLMACAAGVLPAVLWAVSAGAATTTTTTITSHPLLPSLGEELTITFSVTGGDPNVKDPNLQGTVVVSDGATSCSGSIADGFCHLAFQTTGRHNLVATFTSANAAYASSTSAPVMVFVGPLTQVLIASGVPSPSTVGQPATFTVALTAGGALLPGNPPFTGSVRVSNGSISCGATLPNASCSLTFSSAGTQPLFATYSGDANYLEGISPAFNHQVVGPPPGPSPSASATQSPSPSSSPSASPVASVSPSPSASASPGASPSPSSSPTATGTASPSPTGTPTLTPTAGPSASPTATPPAAPPGWALETATAPGAPGVFLAVRGSCATAIYGYVNGEWLRYFTTAPAWVSSLTSVEAGRAYWVGRSC